MDTINEKLRATFAQVLGEPFESINMETSPRNLKSWDSLKHVELVIAVEEAFGITFGTTEITSINSARGFALALKTKGVLG